VFYVSLLSSASLIILGFYSFYLSSIFTSIPCSSVCLLFYLKRTSHLLLSTDTTRPSESSRRRDSLIFLSPLNTMRLYRNLMTFYSGYLVPHFCLTMCRFKVCVSGR
jgi:hypothetical protein